MKGAIFIALNEMVVEEYGLATWLTVLDKADVEGAYTGTENYPDSELFTLVAVICEILQAPASSVLNAFGKFLFHFLHQAHPVFADNHGDFFSFISSIDGVIHVEVHKLDEHAQTPKIEVEQANDHEAMLTYYSPRKLCYLAEGLLSGAAEHFGIQVSINQTRCMHYGAEDCQLHLIKIQPEAKVSHTTKVSAQ